MRTSLTSAIALTAALALGTPVGAAVLATAPSMVIDGADMLSCNIVNMNTKPQTVTIDAMDSGGGVGASSGPFEISPLNAEGWPDNSSDAAWCRFTVGGSANRWRATAVYTNGGAFVMSIPAQ